MLEQVKLPPLEVRRRCFDILIEESRRFDIEPALVTAHVRIVRSNQARRAVQRRLIEELGLKRHVVALLFGRDLRRVRASVLGESERTPRRKRMRKLAPCAPVGDQFVWMFAMPQEAPSTVSVSRFMRPLPERVRSQISDEERGRLVEFHERQMRELIRAR